MNPVLNLRRVARLLPAALLLMLLAGCERTVFQHPPGAAESCDPELVGTWLSQGDSPDEHGELTATVDAGCSLTTVEKKQSGPRRSPPTQLHTARIDGVRYLWLDAAWANESFEVEADARNRALDQPSDVYLYAYHLSRGTLRLAAPPHRALARRVLDKDIPGEILMREDHLTVRLTGEPEDIRKVLRKHRLFRFDEALHFKRAAGDPAP